MKCWCCVWVVLSRTWEGATPPPNVADSGRPLKRARQEEQVCRGKQKAWFHCSCAAGLGGEGTARPLPTAAGEKLHIDMNLSHEPLSHELLKCITKVAWLLLDFSMQGCSPPPPPVCSLTGYS